VVNSGSIKGTGTIGIGVYLAAGGSVTNAASASITGGFYGVVINAGTVVNSGSVVATGKQRVRHRDGRRWFAHQRGLGVDRGGDVGLIIGGGAGTVVNSGSITATLTSSFGIEADRRWFGSPTQPRRRSRAEVVASSSAAPGRCSIPAAIAGNGTAGNGVYMRAGGSVTNAASGSIAGHVGVYLKSGGTVTNAGTITGSGGTAVSFLGTANDLVVAVPGAVFIGKVSGSTSASNALELAVGGSGTLSGLGTNFTGFGTVTVDGGAAWELIGTNTLAAGATLTNSAR